MFLLCKTNKLATEVCPLRRRRHDLRLIPQREAHVFIFPLPLQGPVNNMLKLAEILSINQIKVTFLNTDYIHQRLITHTDASIRFRNYPDFCFRTVPDGLPEDNPRTGDQIGNLLESMDASAVPIFREMLLTAETPVTCLIADGIFTFATDVAAEIGAPLLYFDTVSPCGFRTYLLLPKLIETGEVPFKGVFFFDLLVIWFCSEIVESFLFDTGIYLLI